MRNEPRRTPGPAPALLATRDAALTEAVLATALALGSQVEVVAHTDDMRRAWATAPLRLVGVDLAERAELLGRRAGTFVVAAAGTPGTAEASARLHAPVLELPSASDTLAALLTADADGDGGRVVQVVGGSGGLGVSSLVVGLAARAAAGGESCAAVELAGCGGGLDLLFGAETRGGLRWAELANARGQLGDLTEHLVACSGVSVLPLGREDPAHPDDAAVAAVLASLVRSHRSVIVDGGRGDGPGLGTVVGTQAQQVLLVVGADVASVAASRMAAERLGLASARLVVRTGPGRTLPAEAVAESLGMELAGVVRQDRAVTALAEAGGSVASSRARRFTADVRRIWAEAAR